MTGLQRKPSGGRTPRFTAVSPFRRLDVYARLAVYGPCVGPPLSRGATPDRTVRERARRGARRAPEPAARRSARAATPRPRGTAPAVLRRRHRKRADAGTRRCAADAPRPSAAGWRRRGSSRRRRPVCRAANLRISPSISRGVCWGNLPSTRTKATWYAKPNRLWGPRRRAISRRSASRKMASRTKRGRETSGSETGTALSERNERSCRTVQQQGTSAPSVSSLLSRLNYRHVIHIVHIE